MEWLLLIAALTLMFVSAHIETKIHEGKGRKRK